MKNDESVRPRSAVALVGPTASGKTGLAIRIAQSLGTDIIGVDSRQIYRRLDVGTAKPSAGERLQVHHHLVDFVEPDDPFNVGRYRNEVTRILPSLERAGKIPFFVGGTGMYLKGVLEGLCPTPPADPALRTWLKSVASMTGAGMHTLLGRVDPEAAERLHPNDSYRTLRALEVYYLTGEPLSSLQARHRFSERPFRTIIFGLATGKEELSKRIRLRLEHMVKTGFIAEVESLLNAGYDPSLPSLKAVGYPQMISFLQGNTSLENAIGEARQATWQYARRQMTWFRSVKDVIWLDSGANRSEESLAGEILEKINRWEQNSSISTP